MFNPKSDYARNKLDKEAIVCPSVTGIHIRLTREDFASEEEFLYWKQLSDGDYKDMDSAGRGYYDNCIPLNEAWKYGGVSAEGAFFEALVNWSSARYASTCMGDNDTCSRPSTDLRRSPAAHVWNGAVEL